MTLLCQLLCLMYSSYFNCGSCVRRGNSGGCGSCGGGSHSGSGGMVIYLYDLDAWKSWIEIGALLKSEQSPLFDLQVSTAVFCSGLHHAIHCIALQCTTPLPLQKHWTRAFAPAFNPVSSTDQQGRQRCVHGKNLALLVYTNNDLCFVLSLCFT